MEASLCVRKGAWSQVEDDLLRACVRQYGEGKWNLVPARAGLNRCRKSCRLRWLNYLKPNINRGEFKEDEVDMMMRLHRLLGNRWSLIAGRLPGRTQNDVKNFWNTYIRRRVSSHKVVINAKAEEKVKPHIVIKPWPPTFSRTSPWLRGRVLREHQGGVPTQACASSSECNKWRGQWWETMMEHKGGNIENDTCCLGDHQDGTGKLMKDFHWGEELDSLTAQGGEFLVEGQSWSNFILDTNLWDSWLKF